MRRELLNIEKQTINDLKKILALFTFIIILVSCKGKINASLSENFKGEYFYSEDKNLSYFIPDGFIHFIVKDENHYNKIISTITNTKLKNLISSNYIEGHILPIAENFQYLYKEDSTNYQNIFINEVKHIRLNDAAAEVLSGMNKRLFNKFAREYSAEINWEKDYIINKDDYQIIVNSGNIIEENDTTYWENYIVSKFYRTFTITTKSNIKGDFLPYISKVQFGDKTQKL